MQEDALQRALVDVLSTLIESDEGELFLVSESPERVHVHLRGRFAGCPGTGLAVDQIIVPLIKKVRPRAVVEVSSGALLPDGASRLSRAGS